MLVRFGVRGSLLCLPCFLYSEYSYRMYTLKASMCTHVSLVVGLYQHCLFSGVCRLLGNGAMHSCSFKFIKGVRFKAAHHHRCIYP